MKDLGIIFMTLPAAFKIALGIEQIWMIVELIFNVESTLKTFENRGRVATMEAKIEEELKYRVTCGRITVTTLLFLWLFTVSFMSLLEIGKTWSGWEPLYGTLFILLFFGLLITVTILIVRLRMQFKLINLPNKVLKRETRLLSTILAIFSFSYILRAVIDLAP